MTTINSQPFLLPYPSKIQCQLLIFLTWLKKKRQTPIFTDEELVTMAQETPEHDEDQEEAEEWSAIPITKVFSKVDQIKF